MLVDPARQINEKRRDANVLRSSSALDFRSATLDPEVIMRSLRCAAFVGPYFISGKSFLTTTATLSTKGSAELNDPGMRIAVLRASTSQTFAQQTIPKATLVTTKDYDEAINLVSQGKADIMIADLPA